MPQLSMKELLEAGVHFGHQTRRWNPKMKQYIYGARNGIYIVDLHQTIKLFEDALKFVQNVVNDGGSVLFVGTKKQAQAAVKETAQRSGVTRTCQVRPMSPRRTSKLASKFGSPSNSNPFSSPR